ncbi:GIY-YIG nuclease family protein [Paenibacillus pabuli]|uniref:GIY-YIG nuclease family protein n=1 Tax=Paenibacillus pabuli TaxID=1472 RepID=UPI001FFFFBA9|nr:GIY-YIG nuclease family protein [Paenibacillus pabuli]UPK45895.1 GIY-YIG nuclease family protein [Paenibacillus pabuli]
MYDIYVITNRINGKRYVGYTSKGYESRFNDHIKQSRGPSERYLCRAIRKYGTDNFFTEVIEQVDTLSEAAQREMFFINELNTFAHKRGSHGYNATLGGEGMNGVVFSEETRNKISESHKLRGSFRGESNPKFGKGHLMKGENHPLFGTVMSDQIKEKISKTNKGRLKGCANPAIKDVTCYSLECSSGVIEMFDSFFELRESFKDRGLELNRSSVLGVMRGDRGRNTYKGFLFFREDVTSPGVFRDIQHKFRSGIIEPIEIKDHRKGHVHPNAKSVTSIAVNTKDGRIYKFDCWFDLKNWIDSVVGSNVTYSNLYKVLTGEYSQTRGYKLYREDITHKDVMTDLLFRFNEGRTFND